MVEGFLYIFFGILFLRTVIRYSTNLRFIYILLPLAIYPWYKPLIHAGSSTPVAAIGIAIVVYLFLSKRLLWGILGAITGIIGVVLNWSWLCMKFAARPLVWRQLVVNMFYHPIRKIGGETIDVGIELSPAFERFLTIHIPNYQSVKPWLAGIFGKGFSDYLDPEYTWVDKDVFGWSYKQNDYFYLAEALGPIVLIFLGWFIVDSLRKIGIQPALILFIAVILTCFFQLTMFFPWKAGICLMVSAIAIQEGIRRSE